MPLAAVLQEAGLCSCDRMTTIRCQMTTYRSQRASGISALFASGSLARLLGVFVLEPQRRFYQRELERLLGVPLRQLQRDLERLERAGLITETPSGNRRYYQAVVSHPAFADVRAMMIKTVGLGDVVRAAIAPLGGAIAAAFVFGSFAAGDDTTASDVDLFVVGTVSRRELAGALAPVGTELGREINPVVFSPGEFARRRQGTDPFVESVLAGPHIWILGDEQTLAALA